MVPAPLVKNSSRLRCLFIFTPGWEPIWVCTTSWTSLGFVGPNGVRIIGVTHVAALGLPTAILSTRRSHGTVETRSTKNHPCKSVSAIMAEKTVGRAQITKDQGIFNAKYCCVRRFARKIDGGGVSERGNSVQAFTRPILGPAPAPAHPSLTKL